MFTTADSMIVCTVRNRGVECKKPWKTAIWIRAVIDPIWESWNPSLKGWKGIADPFFQGIRGIGIVIHS